MQFLYSRTYVVNAIYHLIGRRSLRINEGLNWLPHQLNVGIVEFLNLFKHLTLLLTGRCSFEATFAIFCAWSAILSNGFAAILNSHGIPLYLFLRNPVFFLHKKWNEIAWRSGDKSVNPIVSPTYIKCKIVIDSFEGTYSIRLHGYHNKETFSIHPFW